MRGCRKPALVVAVGALAFGGGCASQRVAFVSSHCASPQEAGRLKSLDVSSSFEARGLTGQQLIYRVRLFDRSRSPLRSRDGRYETADGIVAATTSMMVFQSPQVFKDVRVSIPAPELHVPPNHLPVLAEITVLRAGGERVGTAWRSIPPLQATQVMPPLVQPPVAYWFTRVADPNRLPIMLGPFDSPDRAEEAAASDGMEAPKRVYSNEYLWFVPLYSPGQTQRTLLFGPFCCESDASQIPRLLESMPDLVPKGMVAGAPVEVQVQQWLKQRDTDGAPPAPSPETGRPESPKNEGG